MAERDLGDWRRWQEVAKKLSCIPAICSKSTTRPIRLMPGKNLKSDENTEWEAISAVRSGEIC